jgi:hypothetical protein
MGNSYHDQRATERSSARLSADFCRAGPMYTMRHETTVMYWLFFSEGDEKGIHLPLEVYSDRYIASPRAALS